MVSKKNFQQTGRVMPQLRPSVRATAPYKKPFKTQMLFSASQIPDNPGYMDFNNPTPPINNSVTAAHPSPPPQQQPQSHQQKKKNNKNKQKNNIVTKVIPPQLHNGMNIANSNWNKKQQILNNIRLPNGMQRGFHGPQLNGPMRGRGGRIFGIGHRTGPMPPPPHGFQPPPPIIPPMVHPPIGRGPMPGMPPMVNGGGPLPPPPPPFMRRSTRNMPPIPPSMPPMLMPPRMPRGLPPAVPFNNLGGKIKKPNAKIIKKVVKAKSSIKTLKNLINQYPIDKPWVTDIIRAEYNKKVDIENRLKGNKNDELFAQFKTQRDKFVAIYETAREEFLKQEAAAVKAKDGGNKDKQTNTKTAANNGNQSKDAIPKPNNSSNANVNVVVSKAAA